MRKPIDLTGCRFGRLVAIEPGRRSGRSAWKCLCDCGNTKIIQTNHLKSKATVSCGCGKNHRLPSGQAAFNALYRNYINCAISRDIAFDLSKKDFQRLTKQNCFYCDVKPAQRGAPSKSTNGHYVYNGIDRINSSLGYTLSNCITACGVCNKMKLTHSLEFFINHVKKIANCF